MTKRWGWWVLGAAILALIVASVLARSDASSAPSAAGSAVGVVDPTTGAILVDLDDDAGEAERAEVVQRLAAAIAPFSWPTTEAGLGARRSAAAQLSRVRVPASEVADVLSGVGADEDVEGVEVERAWSLPPLEASMRGPLARRDSDRFVPNDPYYDPYQWHLAQIGMPEAWSRARGAGAVVAVIDTGVAYRTEGSFTQAPDLAQTQFVDGWDFIGDDAHPDDDHGHGTHVAGTIAQSTNNGLGVAGVAPEASIMPLKVLDRNGSGGWGAIAAAIRWAADHGANVINMSLGGGMPSRTVQRAIDYAHEKGVLVVAAAGNSGRSRVEYPARHEHVLAVGAVRFDRELTFYSNYGEGLDIVAPGGDLRVDQNGDGMPDGVLQNTLVGGDPNRFDYLAWQGTSMASPHAAGVAALVYGAGVRDPDTVASILQRSATDLGDARKYGSGLVQADAAVQLAGQGTAAARTGLALGLVILLGFALRRRGKLDVGLLPTATLTAVLAGGLGVLPWVGALAGGALGHGLVGALAGSVGPWAALLALTVAPALAAVALGHHIPRLRPMLVALSLSSAAVIVVEAVLPTLPLALPALVVGPWLVVNAVAATGLGWLVARKA